MTLSEEEIKVAIDKMFMTYEFPKPERTFCMWTDERGMADFDNALKKTIAKDNVTLLKKYKKINSSESKNLIKMINSTDIENLSLASVIIEQKLKLFSNDRSATI